MKNIIAGIVLASAAAFSVGLGFGLNAKMKQGPTPAAWRITLYSHGEASQTWVTPDEPQLERGHWWFRDKHGDDVAISGTVSIEAYRETPNEPTPAKPSILVPKKPGNLGAKE